MSVTGLEVLQDAVKIGLGALIGGGITLLTESGRYRRERKSKYADRKREVFEEAADNLGQYFSVLNDTGHLIDVYLASKSKWSGSDIATYRDAINKRINSLREDHHKLTSFYNSMLLFSEKDIADSIVEFSGKAQEICPFDGPFEKFEDSIQDVGATRADLRRIRSEVMDKMASSMSKTA